MLVVVCLGSQSVTSRPSSTASGFWHTDGVRIADATGRTVRVAGITWYGMESSHWVPAGLDFQRYTTIMDEVKLLGFNTIRLPFSNELVERNPSVTDAVHANPGLRGKRALQVLDAIVEYAGRIRLKIILDDHRSRAARPWHMNTLDEPLWYTRDFPDSAWIHDWQTLARRYRNQNAVAGFDLRNEPHTSGPGPWNLHAYLYQGATWGPYKGVDVPARDWRSAAERAGNAVLAINPNLLVVVEGLQLYPDPSAPDGVTSTWWSGILTPVRAYPVVLKAPHRLVYSPHDWGPFKWNFPWFKGMTDRSLARVWTDRWAFIGADPKAAYAAPIWLGEFGTCTRDPQCIDAVRPGNQARWFRALVRFLGKHPTMGWAFFALNGTNSNNCRTDNGILNGGWNRVVSPELVAALRGIQPTDGARSVPAHGLLIPGAVANAKPRSAQAALCRLP